MISRTNPTLREMIEALTAAPEELLDKEIYCIGTRSGHTKDRYIVYVKDDNEVEIEIQIGIKKGEN